VKFAPSGDVRIAYEERGEGPPLLLVHGLGYDHHGWGPLPPLLAGDFGLVLVDNRGVGESDAPSGPYTVAGLAADAAAVLDAAGVERAHVVGVSLGGFVAQELAISHARRVDRLVLLSTSPGGPNQYPMPEQTVESFRAYQRLDRDAALRQGVENSLGDRAVRERPDLVDEVYAYRLERAPPLEPWLAQLAAGTEFDVYERLPEIAAPTLALTGGDDVVIDPRNSDLLAERIPDAKLEVVPGRGHLLFWEEPELVASIVREFVLAT
jgi:pimeloyl-ACP methyl ester carboxylesterase